VQLRTLLKNGRTQSSVGSGFLIGTSDIAVTNYHVMSQIALEPDTYVGEYVDTNGKRGTVELLAVDVLHDLAVVRIGRRGGGFFNVPDALPELTQGQYLYSLGNPLDLGFAISEGAYNGVIKRSFYGELMFTGPINAGMSGGPGLTVDGRVAGVNVSHRLDGELVSFLVPVRYVRDLLKRVAAQKETPKDFKQVVGQQLLEHQATMMEKLAATPLTFKELKPYRVPVWESDQVRCWGSANAKQNKSYSFDQVNCAMESALFVSHQTQTGHISIHHKLLQAPSWAICASPHWRAGCSTIRASADTRIRATRRRAAWSSSWVTASCRCARCCARAPTASSPDSMISRCSSPAPTAGR
jgi:hypothetical protein